MNRNPHNRSMPSLYDPSASDILRDQSLGLRNGIYQPVREENLLLRDTTLGDVSTTKHGFAPKVPNDATKYLDGTGAYSVPVGDPLGKTFFSTNSFLPANTLFEALYTFPAIDFKNMNGQPDPVRSMSRARWTGANPQNFGWDVGALKTRMLVIFGLFRVRTSGSNIFMSDTLPSASEIPNKSWMAGPEPFSGVTILYKRVSSAFTSLATEAGAISGDAYGAANTGLAFYYDDATDRLIVFLRYGAEQWFPVIDTTNTSLTTVRYCGIRCAAGSALIYWAGCPMGVYYD